MELTLDQALHKAIEAHKAGQIQDAERFYTAILQVQPNHPDANHNLGVLAVGVGKTEEALPFFKMALEANQGITQFWSSYIEALIKLGRVLDATAAFHQAKDKGIRGEVFDRLKQRIDELNTNVKDTKLRDAETTAKESGDGSKANTNVASDTDSKRMEPPPEKLQEMIDLYNQGEFHQVLDKIAEILTHFPESATLHNIRGAVYGVTGQFGAAIESYKQAINIKPDFAEAHYNMAVAVMEEGNLDEAIEIYKQAIKIKSDYAEAYSNMGVALKGKGELEAAIKSYKQAINIKPDYALAYSNMGVALQEKGEHDAAISSYKQAIEIKPDYTEAYSNIGSALRLVAFTKSDPDLQSIIALLLGNGTYVRPIDISTAAISLLKFEPGLQEALRMHVTGDLARSLHETISTLSDLPLLLKLMSVCPIDDLELEALLKDLRSCMLLSACEIEGHPEVLRFLSALALQCFTNEYIYDETDEDAKALAKLEFGIEEGLSVGQQPSPQSILCLAAYKSLHEYGWCELLTMTPDIEEVYTRQILEPKKEARLKSDIVTLHGTTDNVSLKVREQYEVNPYPRWVNLGLDLNPKTLPAFVREQKIRLFDDAIVSVTSPNILVAGCGTGQHPMEAASKIRNSKVLAVDLSLSSLAYAKRKTEELGVQNLEYMQADILNLEKLERRFDIIESAGVLHHMDDPMEGWRVLANCLNPGGLMKIGLYSELSRQHISKIRDEINQLGYDQNDDLMKRFRISLINSDKAHHKKVLTSKDFYSLSAFRDLLLHVREHQFSIPQIKTCLDELGLKFCGFSDDRILGRFEQSNTGPDDFFDLDKWHAYEESYPDTFSGMYQFWCQKVA